MRLFWFFTIRKRIKKRIASVTKEKEFFESGGLNVDYRELLNNKSRIEAKKEIIYHLESLLRN